MWKADLQTGQCISNTVPCSAFTKAKKTVCVRLAKKSSLCPITDVRLVESRFVEVFLANQKEGVKPIYQKATSVETKNWALLYSKNFDGPPIRDFELEEQPTCDGRRIVENPTIEQLTFSRGSMPTGLQQIRNNFWRVHLSSKLKINFHRRAL